MSKTKVEYRSGSTETYKRFCAANPDVHLSKEQWSKIIYTYNYIVRDYILDSGDISKVPFGIGLFTISKKKIKKHKVDPWNREWVNLPIDWKKTKEEGKYVYLFNNHSDGYRYKWRWFNKTARFYMSAIWNFIPSRDTSRKLAQYLKKPGSVYSEIYQEW
jgi:hypothetical protein